MANENIKFEMSNRELAKEETEQGLIPINSLADEVK
jgi:hypothetical protein